MAGIVKLIFVLLLTLVLSGCSYNNTKQVTKQTEVVSSVKSEVTVYQKITIDDKTQNFTAYEAQTDETALTLLQRTAQVKMTGEGQNAYVTEINGRKADDKKKEYWAFLVNNKLANVGAGSYKIIKGDKIEWKIETF